MLRDKLEKGKFIITCEVLTPLDLDLDKDLKVLSELDQMVDGFNIPFCPLGKLRPHSLVTGIYIKEHLTAEPILHLSARHHTILSFEATLLLCQSVGIENILLVTGDPSQEGEGSYRLNSISLLKLAKDFNQGLTYSRKRLFRATNFLIGAAFNPNCLNLKGEILRLKEKFKAGAEMVFTQPVFNPNRFRSTIEGVRETIPGLKIIGGLTFLFKRKTALRLRKFLGIPYQYIDHLDERDETDLLFEIALSIKDLVDGFYIIPIGRYERAVGLIQRIKAAIG